ncbi:HEAT repeat domain-containing protein [Chamaesiphon polymorphus]|uniref:Phycocyanobilin lyase n=1 Tax=Chamaesiphon polymorphus CCALA 037 TaxID=2107692 RepID=A0A2T1FKN6_9CYAN|nr:HEAT repeat domain-containing protein [Chamaesiphon polymorphus]PSB45533.1 phycocyanobilin lyase [Chamaesiphon polymorphus CCALA 037]
MTEPDLLQPLLLAISEADSSPRMVEAVEKLSQARLEAAIPNLIAILGYNNPGAAVAAVEGLISLGKPAVMPLLELLDGYNYGARAWGLRALAGIGDPKAIDLLLDAAANDFALSVRRAAARGLGTIHWEELAPEEIAPAQSKVIEVLLQVSQDHEWVVRYAAITGLQELAIASIISNPDLTRQILVHFDRLVESDDNIAVIARIWLAQKEIQDYITEILSQQPELEPQLEIDWQQTLEKLYARKRREQPRPEGDPHKFRDLAAAIVKGDL